MSRIQGLDGLRALACLLVIAHHTLPRLPQSDTVLSNLIQTAGNLAQAGVSIFFVLSGFLLSLPYWKASYANQPFPSFKDYLIKRFARIVPGFYVAILISFILSITVFGATATGELFVRLFSGLLFVNSYHPVTIFPTEVNAPLWSIGFEVTSYLILLGLLATAVFTKVTRYNHLLTLMGFGTFAVALAHLGWVAIAGVPTEQVGWEYGLIGFARTWAPYTNIFSLYAHFHLGVLAAALFPLLAKHPRSAKFDLILAATLIALAIAFAAEWILLPSPMAGLFHLKYFWPAFPLIVAAAVILVPFTRWTARILELKPLPFLAKISFGLYIWHMIFVKLTALYIFPDYTFNGGMTFHAWLAATGFVLALSIATAWLSWTYIEKPVMDWSRKFLKVREKKRTTGSRGQNRPKPAV